MLARRPPIKPAREPAIESIRVPARMQEDLRCPWPPCFPSRNYDSLLMHQHHASRDALVMY
eukprot:scaffold98391_cov13-Tisochrysis_lutea.AAC.1